MRWTIRIKDEAAQPGIDWAQQYLSQFDTSKLKYINLNPGSKHAYGVYGHCTFPTQSEPQYKIACHVPGPFPCKIKTRKPPLYQRSDGSFPRAPKGCRRTTLCYAPGKTKGEYKQWYRVVSHTEVHAIDEAVVWIFAHEAFHFLRRTKQIPGRNNEIQADQFADDLLDQYRTEIGLNSTPEPGITLFCWLKDKLKPAL